MFNFIHVSFVAEPIEDDERMLVEFILCHPFIIDPPLFETTAELDSRTVESMDIIIDIPIPSASRSSKSWTTHTMVFSITIPPFRSII
jgi:hypothetical protein